jgi:basic amino acid/polyamine antiporter, APA family
MGVASEAQQPPRLKRSLGLWAATALVVGNMVGSGVFLLPSSLAQDAGPISVLGWVLTGAGAMLLALVFAKLGRAFPRTGGPYAYARRAFGDFVGFQMAWGYWIAVWAGNAAIAVAFVGYTAVFWHRLATDSVLAALVGIGVIWLLTFTNVLGAREGGLVQVVTTVLKFVPIALLAFIGLFYVDSDNFTPFAPHGVGHGLNAAATLTLWAFIGLESATVPAEEVKDPERTIPRATILGTLAAAIVYLLATITIFGVVPQSELANSTSPFADAAGAMFGGSWNKVIAAVAMIASFGALNGWILLQGRVPLAAAEDGVFPEAFARVHGARRTPVFGLVVSSVLVSLLMLMNYNAGLVDQFNEVVLIATLTTVVPYAYAAAAELYMFVSDRALFSGTNFARHTAIALLAFAYSVWATWGAGKDVISKGFIMLMVGIPIYVYLKWHQSKEVAHVTPPVGEGEIRASSVRKESVQ